MSPELRLIAAPAATYAALARAESAAGPWSAMRRPLLVAIVLGSTVAILGTRHVTPALLFSATISWSVVVVAQVLIALVTIAGPARRTVGVVRALDLFFAGHAPWSLWMLAVAAYAAWSPVPSLWAIEIGASLSFVLTVRIVAAFFRQVLALEPREAIARTAVHQVITWALLIGIFAASVGIVPRLMYWIG